MTATTTTHLQGVQKYALAAYRVFVDAGQKNSELFETLMVTAHRATIARVLEAAKSDDEGVGTLIETIDGPLYIAEIEEGRDGLNVIMTSDGNPVDNTGWYTGKDYDFVDSIRYEDWTFDEDGKLTQRYHGWIEANSRKIVQVG